MHLTPNIPYAVPNRFSSAVRSSVITSHECLRGFSYVDTALILKKRWSVSGSAVQSIYQPKTVILSSQPFFQGPLGSYGRVHTAAILLEYLEAEAVERLDIERLYERRLQDLAVGINLDKLSVL